MHEQHSSKKFTLKCTIMKILIVDDEHDVEPLYRQSFRREMRAGEIELLFAFSGQEALGLMASLDPMDIVLLLSDINMPGMTGFDLLEHTHREYPHLKIVMVSAYGDTGNQSKAKDLGAEGFITKPVDIHLLKETIRTLA